MIIEDWRIEYTAIRPHSSLGYKPPAPEAILPQDTKGGFPGLPRLKISKVQPYEWYINCRQVKQMVFHQQAQAGRCLAVIVPDKRRDILGYLTMIGGFTVQQC